MKNYKSIVHDCLSSTDIEKNLKVKDAVVLERIARGGGATNWYYCNNVAAFNALKNELSPGSVVSFYFDERIEKCSYSKELNFKIEEIITRTGDCVVGLLKKDAINIDVDYVTSAKELSEFVSQLEPCYSFFYGQFPARDNDGSNAITITLPDEDGIVRAHPH
ncbi:MAG: hypothetical protein OEZ39_03690 [Gammaproteobacteria bacterium]|nr:hypothetical protein [Gammaproteobacteria bacterium]